MIKNLLVTGGAGFIGSHFIDYALASKNYQRIINIDKCTYAANHQALARFSNHKGYQFIKADCADSETLAAVLADYPIDAIIHFAAESHVDRSISSPKAFVENNILSTLSLLELARQHRCRFHHISTDEVYGPLAPDQKGFSLGDAYNPSSPYAASKAACDHLVMSYGRTYQLPFSLSYCTNNYGPSQHSEKLIPKVINRCLTKQPIELYGNGRYCRDWLFVTDHCKALDTILRQDTAWQCFQISANDRRSNFDVAVEIRNLVAQLSEDRSILDVPIEFIADRPSHDSCYGLDVSSIQRLGWQATTPWQQGLTMTVEQAIGEFYAKATTTAA